MQAEGERREQSAIELLDEVWDEIHKNQEFYEPFLTGDWEQQFRAYRFDKVFDSDFVDIIIYALSNLTLRTCEVFTADSGQLKKAFDITPGRVHESQQGSIALLLMNEHYEPLLDNEVSQIRLLKRRGRGE